MRFLVLAAVLVPQLSHADGYPQCDATDEPSYVQILEPPLANGYAPDCALRVLAFPEVAEGLRFDHRRGETVLDTRMVTTGSPQEAPVHQHACDGSVTDGSRIAAYEYGYLAPGAQIGDTVDVYQGTTLIGSVPIVDFGCPTLDWATDDCTTCDDPIDDTVGCNATGGGTGLAIGLLAAVTLLRRRHP